MPSAPWLAAASDAAVASAHAIAALAGPSGGLQLASGHGRHLGWRSRSAVGSRGALPSGGFAFGPCYGATETAAMVTVQTPQAFLAGHRSCGQPLEGVRLRLDPDGALAVHCDRLAVARLDPAGGLQALVDAQGWWRTGDLATLGDAQVAPDLQVGVAEMVRCNPVASRSFLSSWRIVCWDWRIRPVCPLGRADARAARSGVGARLVALVRWSTSDRDAARMDALRALVSGWPAAERPRRWVPCADLAPSRAGKWDRRRWQTWLLSQQSAQQQEQDVDVV